MRSTDVANGGGGRSLVAGSVRLPLGAPLTSGRGGRSSEDGVLALNRFLVGGMWGRGQHPRQRQVKREALKKESAAAGPLVWRDGAAGFARWQAYIPSLPGIQSTWRGGRPRP
ncbi:hypothetical protein AAFF_G00418780 [Aldrovandia affinis]|uniref:Uncharacterized protein n=1 Tax=Aldrovandia affinis TaxID=143900 RepID=A0AAD7WIW9_9TELE|nr:hypothetical protein AAFF_G00418780 [Aldrovandia affinis]